MGDKTELLLEPVDSDQNIGAQERHASLSFNLLVDEARLGAYLMFALEIVVGKFLTTYYSDVDLEHNMIKDIYGYNNACVYFDDPPATYVAIAIQTIATLFFCLYLGLRWTRIWLHHHDGLISRFRYRVYTVETLIELFGIIYAMQWFAVHPAKNFFMHTLPFSILIIVLAMMSVSNTVYCLNVGWRHLNLPTWFRYLVIAYVALECVVSAQKIYFQFNGIVLGHPPDPFYGRANDLMWMTMALYLPTLSAAFQTWAARDSRLKLPIESVNIKMTGHTGVVGLDRHILSMVLAE